MAHRVLQIFTHDRSLTQVAPPPCHKHRLHQYPQGTLYYSPPMWANVTAICRNRPSSACRMKLTLTAVMAICMTCLASVYHHNYAPHDIVGP